MLSAYRTNIEENLEKLRFGDPDTRHFQLGVVTGLLSAYLHTQAIQYPVYQRLTALKNSAYLNGCTSRFQPGQQAQIKPL